MAAEPDQHKIAVDLDQMLLKREMTLSQLSRYVGIPTESLATLNDGRTKAIRLSTLTSLCEALDCQPGDLLRYAP
jgi:putative transcriptional regulator